MSGVDDTYLFAHGRTLFDDGVVYTPFIKDGMVGFQCLDAEGRCEYIYMNPSDHTDGDVPNVFVYHGHTGDPAEDFPVHHYTVLQED